MRVSSLTLLLFVLPCFERAVKAQTLYLETFDASPDLPAGWTRDPDTSSTAEIANNTPSPGSGLHNLYIKNCRPVSETRSVRIDGISTTGHSQISLGFLHRRTAAFNVPVTLSWSMDGSSWTEIPSFAIPATESIWQSFNTALPEDAANQANLSFRFQYTTNNLNNCQTATPNYRLDDFQVSAGSLPLDWVSFTANRTEDRVKLEWETAREESVQSFDVEFSTDGSRFISIKTLFPASAADVFRKYQFVHSPENRAVLYYRIRATDLDGSMRYSSVCSVPARPNSSWDCKVLAVTLHTPSFPGSDSLSGDQISVFDISGKMALHFTAGSSNGNQLNALLPGFYVLRLDSMERFGCAFPFIISK